MKLNLVLHNIRSIQNVGAIFRTADAIGVSKIYLTGYTPAPTDRFGRKRKDFTKSALGAENFVAWESREIVELLEQFKKEGVEVVALEQSLKAVDYKKFKLSFPTALILGNEVDGIPQEIIAQCDSIIEIPMHGRKESLNVSVAAGVVLYRLLDGV